MKEPFIFFPWSLVLDGLTGCQLVLVTGLMGILGNIAHVIQQPKLGINMVVATGFPRAADGASVCKCFSSLSLHGVSVVLRTKSLNPVRPVQSQYGRWGTTNERGNRKRNNSWPFCSNLLYF